MGYIVVEYKGKKAFYVEDYESSRSLYITEDRSEAYTFGLAEANAIAIQNGMTVEKAD